LRYLASQEANPAGSLAVGIGSAPAAVTDTCLTYEFARVNLKITTIDFNNSRIIYKSTLPIEISGTIYEIGIYSTNNNTSLASGSRSLLEFESGEEQWTGGTFVTSENRLGENALRISAGSGGTSVATLNNSTIDLSGYSNLDTFSFAFFTDANTSSVRLRFADPITPGSYFESVIVPTAVGANFATFSKSNFNKVGAVVDWANIGNIEVAATAKAAGATNVDFWGLRIEDSDMINPDSVLVARSVLLTPEVKTSSSPMDIEYAVDLRVNG